MEQFIYQGMSTKERVEYLSKTTKSERITYTRHLTDAEIDHESKELASATKELAAIEEEKKEVAQDFKMRIDAEKAKMQRIADTLIDGNKEVTERCFKVISIEEKEVGFYNELGELVHKRRLLDSDMQMSMFADSGDPAQPIGALASGRELPAAESTDEIEEAEVIEDEQPSEENVPEEDEE